MQCYVFNGPFWIFYSACESLLLAATNNRLVVSAPLLVLIIM